jgi:hypothetical protein
MSLPRAKKVSLARSGLTDATLPAALADGRLPLDAGDLDLDDNPLSAAAVELLGRQAFVRVERLTLARTRLGDAGARALAGATAFRGLRTLSLAETGLTSAGVVALLAEGSAVDGLWGLDLTGNPVGDAGAAAVAASPRARYLQVLNLERTGLTEAGARALAESAQLGSLQVLYVGGNALGERGRELLRKSRALPDCRVDFGAP